MIKWGIDKRNCTKLLRDGAKNAVRAGRLLGVDHMHCTAHIMHLILSGALSKQTIHSSVADIELVYDGEVAHSSEGQLTLLLIQDEAIDEADDHLATLARSTSDPLRRLRAVVQIFRALAVYFRRSSKAHDFLLDHQRSAEGVTHAVGPIVDCPTRWNSTYDMLERLIRLQGALDHFFTYIDSTDGQKEFGNVSLRRPKPEEWFTIKCLRSLLIPFEITTKLLSGYKIHYW